jgi:hypothetical protein
MPEEGVVEGGAEGTAEGSGGSAAEGGAVESSGEGNLLGGVGTEGDVEGSAPAVGIEGESIVGVAPGSSYQDLLAGQPDAIREAPWASNIKSVDDMFNQMSHLQSAVGQKGILPPKEGDEADRERFQVETGRPKEIGDYKLDHIEPPEGVVKDDAMLDHMLGVLFKEGASQELVEKAVQAHYDYAGAQQQALLENGSKEHQETLDTLHNEWRGEEFDKNLELAIRGGMKMFGGDGDAWEAYGNQRLASGTVLGATAQHIKIWAEVGKIIQGDGNVGGRDGSGFEDPKGRAERALEAMMADPAQVAILRDKSHTQHDVLAKRLVGYRKQIYGDGPEEAVIDMSR